MIGFFVLFSLIFAIAPFSRFNNIMQSPKKHKWKLRYVCLIVHVILKDHTIKSIYIKKLMSIHLFTRTEPSNRSLLVLFSKISYSTLQIFRGGIGKFQNIHMFFFFVNVFYETLVWRSWRSSTSSKSICSKYFVRKYKYYDK